jgi:hypothetical protein
LRVTTYAQKNLRACPFRILMRANLGSSEAVPLSVPSTDAGVPSPRVSQGKGQLVSEKFDFRGELAIPFQGCLEAGTQGLRAGASSVCALPGPTLIAQTDDDGAQVGLGIEPGPGYTGGRGYSFEGDGSSLLL